MELREYLLLIRRRWWLIVVVAVVAVVSSYVFAKLQQPIYRSSVKMVVTGRVDYGQTMAITSRLRQMSEMVTTTSVASEVDKRLRLDMGPEALLKEVHVQAFSDTIQIELDVDDVDALRAQQIAGGFAQVFEERYAASMAGTPQSERIYVETLDDPKPGVLFWPQTRVVVLGSGIIGLVLGTVLAYVLGYLDDTLKTADDVARYLGVTTLGPIPTIRATQAGRFRRALPILMRTR